jgi:hypothetical protein
MPDTGWLNFGVFTGNNTPGDVDWTSPANAQTSNNLYAQRGLNSSQSTRGLRCVSLADPATGKPPTIPEGAAITGLAFRWERRKSPSGFHIQSVDARWVVDGAPAGEGIGGAFGLTIGNTSDAYQTDGGDGQLYGLTLTREDALGAGFGVEIRVIRGADIDGAVTYQVDHVQARVHYAEAPDDTGSDRGRGRNRTRGAWTNGHLAGEAA